MENIVIIGGGFSGLQLVKHLDKSKYNIRLIDRNNYNYFPPLFYQIASSGLAESDICFPLRREFARHKNVSYHMGHVKNVDLAAKTVTTSYETLPYDRLVIAAGTTNNYFGLEGLDQEVYCMKSVAQAAALRDEILDRLERGAICKDPEHRRRLLSFLVVGGGPAGVEIAGALGEMKKDILKKEYPELHPEDVNITLVEGTGRLLGAMSEKAGKKALEYLKSLMVNVRLNVRMSGYKDKLVTFSDGHKEYWETLVWTAGVKGEPIPGLPETCLGHGGRIIVDGYNRVKGYEDSVMAIGDIALMTLPDYPVGHPQMAQPAIQQGRNLARNLNCGKWLHIFEYKNKGSMATIGKNRAVADLKRVTISGWIAWMAWLLIHLLSLLGMKNKIQVTINWIWNYWSHSTSLRLLLRPTRYPMRRHWGD